MMIYMFMLLCIYSGILVFIAMHWSYMLVPSITFMVCLLVELSTTHSHFHFLFVCRNALAMHVGST